MRPAADEGPTCARMATSASSVRRRWQIAVVAGEGEVSEPVNAVRKADLQYPKETTFDLFACESSICQLVLLLSCTFVDRRSAWCCLENVLEAR